MLERLETYLSGKSVEAYIVGGWIRDRLLKRETADIDIAVSADAFEVASGVAGLFGGRFVPLDPDNRIARVVLFGEEYRLPGMPGGFDFSTFTATIEEDMARRDFTIDAMAVRLGDFDKRIAPAVVIDPFDGLGDLLSGTIRAVDRKIFTSDPARLMRAVRLEAELGFSMDTVTEELVKRDAALISGIAGERVREELLRLLALPGAGARLARLDELGLLTRLFPELEEMRGVEQPKEHHWDVFNHSLKTIEAVEYLLGEGGWPYVGDDPRAAVFWPDKLDDYFRESIGSGSTRASLLKLAALLHDIHKPQSRTVEDNGRIRFLGHAVDGAEVASGALQRLRFGNREIELVENLVRHHMRPTQLSQSGLPGNRAVYRYYRDTAGAEFDILIFSLADHLAARGPGLVPEGWREHTDLVNHVLRKKLLEESVIHPPKLIDGYDIIRCFGLKPGPRIGKLLEEVREAQASGEVSTREEAQAYIERKLALPDDSGVE